MYPLYKNAQSTTNQILSGALFNLGVVFISFFVIELVLANILFIISIPIKWWLLPVSFFLVIPTYKKLFPDETWRHAASIVFMAILVLFILSIPSFYIYDFSWDGNDYHKYAIGLLERGWNPLYQTMREAELIVMKQPVGYWASEAYPKFSWIFAASLYKIIPNIEVGKVYTLAFIFITIGVSWHYLEAAGLEKLKALALALCVATNPIAIGQWNSFYVDGLLQLVLSLLCLCMIGFYLQPSFRRISLFLICSLIIILSNIKFSGLFFSFFCCCFFLTYYCFYYRSTFRKRIYYLTKLCLLLLLTGGIAVGIAGVTTYTTNFMRHGHIGWPLVGSNSVDIIHGNSPFPDENHITNLLTSIFSYTENFRLASQPSKTVNVKVPFTIDFEKESFINVDSRLAGFGVWFSGVLVLSAIGFAIVLWQNRKNFIDFNLIYIVLCASIITIITPANWWARYTPFVYMIILIFIYSLSLLKTKIKKFYYFSIILLLLCNNLFFAYGTYNFLKSTHVLQEQYKNIGSATPIEFYPGYFRGACFNLYDHNIKFNLHPGQVKDLDGKTSFVRFHGHYEE